MELNKGYLISEALRSIRNNSISTALSTLTLAFAIAILALFILVFVNINGAVSAWGERAVIVAYLKDASIADIPAIRSEVFAIAGVSDVAYVSKDDALNELRQSLKGYESVLEGIGANPLPASIEVKVSPYYQQDTAGVRRIVDALKSKPWAEDVEWSSIFLERLGGFIRFVEASAAVLGAFLVVATVFIISNTIRLTIYSRRTEIEGLSRAGASGVYMRLPFLIEAVMQGFVAGFVAFGVLSLLRSMLEARVPEFMGFIMELPVAEPAMLLLLVASGMALGALGGAISMVRFARV